LPAYGKHVRDTRAVAPIKESQPSTGEAPAGDTKGPAVAVLAIDTPDPDLRCPVSVKVVCPGESFAVGRKISLVDDVTAPVEQAVGAGGCTSA